MATSSPPSESGGSDSEPPRKASSPDLFFPATDSEDEADAPPVVAVLERPAAAPSNGKSAGGSSKAGAVGKKSSLFDVADSDGDDDIVEVKPPSSSTAGPSNTSRKRPSTSTQSSPPPAHPSHGIPPTFKHGYLGEFVCEGWSLSKGKGYCSPGSKIVVERAKPKVEVVHLEETEKNGAKKGVAGGKPGQVRLVNGKVVGKNPAGGKQMTLGGMMGKKTAAPPAKKKKNQAAVDQIIRFRNERGFEIGRLSVQEAGFLAHLLDIGAIHLTGHVIDCPQVLSTGSTILLNIKVYITRKAFYNFRRADRKEDSESYWKNQQETVEEQAMRLRKDSLIALFARIGVKPIQTNALSLAQKKNKAAAVAAKKAGPSSASGSKPAASKKAESKADKDTVKDKDKNKDKGKGKAGKSSAENSGDEDSGDEAEKLDEEQMDEIDNIYRKAQQGDTKLDEMEPPDTFLYTLRPYQKQALTWMNARENGDASVRNQSLHPLWEEYLFKKDHVEGEPIEIESDGDWVDPKRKFYWNPYSGELSLKFPVSKNLSRGGILADAMGMGKTCMMTSLIHTNREDDTPPPSGDAPDVETDEPILKRAKFKQVTLSNQWRAVPTAPRPSVPTARATLVVCPVSLAAQWHEELGKMSEKGSIGSALWYGNDRVDIDQLLGQEGNNRVDVIITTYGTLSSEYQKWQRVKDKPHYEGGGLYEHEFLRIVLDEAHNIKNRNATVSKACYELKGQRRWALSGTPIVNRLEDLYSLLHFLRLTPWGEYSFFRSFVTVPFLAQDPKALNVVQYILESCLLRREKTMRDKDGRLIVDLPPKHLDVQVLEFSRPERQIYKHLEDRAKRKLIELDADGKAMANYTSILAMLLKLRQCVDHPLLVLGKAGDDSELGQQLLDAETGDKRESLKEMIALYARGTSVDGTEEEVDQEYAAKVLKELSEQEETPICDLCSNEMFDEVLLPCYHRFCQDCIVGWIGTCEDQNKPANCPSCSKGPVRLGDLRSIQRRRKRINPISGAFTADDGKPESAGETSVTIGKVNLVSSTKLKALVRKLGQMREEDPEVKALVFSQFTSFLDLIEATLTKEGIRWLRFDGSMSQAQRASTIEAFGKKTDEPLLLLISLKAGGVGLNLTMANHVFMMDTWWNEAIEQQAVDRCHRLGQNKPVYVTRYIIKGTVEKRILKIQRHKTRLVNASLAGGASKDKQTSLADIKKVFGIGEDDSEDEAYDY
ncbi:hypothetical protein IAT38_002745 [Cryptococcus sp. DSM 104549]